MPDAETWLTDDNRNRASVAYFGSREAAQAALDSLVDCVDCVNCKYCAACFSCLNSEWLFSVYNRIDEIGESLPIPVIKKIHTQVYKSASQPGALNMAHWHCGTAHCRAGWVVTLAGPEGTALEARFGTAIAASFIYRTNSPLPVPQARFDDDNATALADMRRMAELEAVA